jgi:hypothetical protein
VVSKCLVNHLIPYLQDIIAPAQSTFSNWMKMVTGKFIG